MKQFLITLLVGVAPVAPLGAITYSIHLLMGQGAYPFDHLLISGLGMVFGASLMSLFLSYSDRRAARAQEKKR